MDVSAERRAEATPRYARTLLVLRGKPSTRKRDPPLALIASISSFTVTSTGTILPEGQGGAPVRGEERGGEERGGEGRRRGEERRGAVRLLVEHAARGQGGALHAKRRVRRRREREAQQRLVRAWRGRRMDSAETGTIGGRRVGRVAPQRKTVPDELLQRVGAQLYITAPQIKGAPVQQLRVLL